MSTNKYHIKYNLSLDKLTEEGIVAEVQTMPKWELETKCKTLFVPKKKYFSSKKDFK